MQGGSSLRAFSWNTILGTLSNYDDDNNNVKQQLVLQQQQQQFYSKAKKYIKHTHCLHLAKAIRGRQCGYSTWLNIKTFSKEN